MQSPEVNSNAMKTTACLNDFTLAPLRTRCIQDMLNLQTIIYVAEQNIKMLKA